MDLISTRRVSLGLRLARSAQVELFGELGDWLNARTLPGRAEADGTTWHGVELEAPNGVYQYKFRLDGEWVLDPENARTRCVDGVRNNVLVVGGASEPVLFAPSLPWIWAEPNGGVVVLAGLRRGGVGDGLSVLWREGPDDPLSRAHARKFVEEGEHVVYRVALPASAAQVELWFELVDGTRVGDPTGAPFVFRRPSTALPDWLRHAVVYTIVVDRFRPGTDAPTWGVDPGADRAAGGDLEGIRRSLDELADLGIDTLHLTPVHVGASCHRYDLVDPLTVDPALGGEAALARLVSDAHAREMRVLLDFSFVHVGRGFPPYEDVLAKGRASSFASWFLWTDGSPPTLRQYGRRTDAPLLDLTFPAVRELALKAVRRAAAQGIDGFRFDAVADVPIELAREVRMELRRLRPDAVVLGEVVPTHSWRWLEGRAVDVATDFSFHAAVTDFVARRSIDAAAFVERLKKGAVLRGGPEARAVCFTSTHDHPRLASIAKLHGDPRRARLGLLLLATSPGIPALLYGEELGMASEEPVFEPENAWGDRLPMPWAKGTRDEPHRALARRLLRARRTSEALRVGETEVLYAEGPVIVFRRRARGEVVDVALNASDEPMELELDDTELDTLEPLAVVGEASIERQLIRLGANAGLVARRLPSEEATSRYRTDVRALPMLRDREFEQGLEIVSNRPTRLDFAVTERCNLRCLHCIALAPERTANRSARTLSPVLLERLREDLAHASYFGFVHGGEALTAPIFFDLLAAIRDARRGEPYVAHVLSNGQLLTRATCMRLVDLGVRSLSVSLDGANAQTNDRIRAGGEFGRIVEHLRGAATLRRELAADVRIGVSVVVLRSNVHELADLARLAKDVGADWIKFEEPVGATDFAKQELVDVTAPEVRSAIDEAIAAARALGLVAVDHVDPPPVWRCRLDEEPRSRSFLEADEFANRATIHPCRAPWERACIHANGDVSVDDFLRPVVGNLTYAPLTDLWSSAIARAERRRVRDAWICGGDVTCARPPRR